MRDYAKQPQSVSRTMDSNSKAANQFSIVEILQRFNKSIVQPVGLEYKDELLQAKFSGKSLKQESGGNEVSLHQKSENNTGLPNDLKAGIEIMSGYSMDDVKVHYNSDKPAQFNAFAYVQGTDIYIGPGQEKYLPHEAWHIVQQKQGRVYSTMQIQGMNVNDSEDLEKEASVMGVKAARLKGTETTCSHLLISGVSPAQMPIQRMLVGIEMETNVPIYQNGTRSDHVDGYVNQSVEYTHINVEETLRQYLGKEFEIHVDSSDLAPKGALNRFISKKIQIMEIVSKPVASCKALLLKLQIAKNFLDSISRVREFTGESYSIGWPTPSSDYTFDNQTFSKEYMEKFFNNDYEQGKNRIYEVAAQLTFQIPSENLKNISDRDKFEYDETRRNPFKKIKNRSLLVTRESMAKAMLLSDSLNDMKTRRIVDVIVKILKDTLQFLSDPYCGTVKNSVSYLVRSDLSCLFPKNIFNDISGFGEEIASKLKALSIESLEIPPSLLKKIYNTKKHAIIVNSSVYKLIMETSYFEKGELEHVNPRLQDSLSSNLICEDEKYFWPWLSFMDWLGEEVKNIFIEKVEVTGPLHGCQNLSLLPEKDQTAEIEYLKQIEAQSCKSSKEEGAKDNLVLQDDRIQTEVKDGVVIEDRSPLFLCLSYDSEHLFKDISDKLTYMELTKDLIDSFNN